MIIRITSNVFTNSNFDAFKKEIDWTISNSKFKLDLLVIVFIITVENYFYLYT